MKTLLLLLVPVLIFFAFTAQAAEAQGPSKKSTAKRAAPKRALPGAQNGQLGTNFSFDAASVHGKYQMAGQGVATVEDEKVLDDLLGLRRSFKDRELQEASRR
jgi:hypothetical protein